MEHTHALENQSGDKPEEKSTMSTKRFLTILSWPVLLPIALCAVVMIGMFVGFGWMLVAMSFFVSLAALFVGVVAIIGACTTASGIGAVLIMLGVGLIGLGLVAPVFFISLDFAKGFAVVSGEVLKKVKEFRVKELLK